MELKNILIFRTGHLGDTLVALPAYWTARKAFLSARLTLLSNANSVNQKYILAQSVLPEKGLFDDWLTYPVENGKLNYLRSFASLLFEIRQRKFDAVIYLMTRNRLPAQVKRDALFFRLCGIKDIIGTEYLLRNYLDPNTSAPLPPVESEIVYLLNCLKYENFPFADEQISADLALTSVEIDCADEWLGRRCFPAASGKRLIAVAPGSKWKSKIWDENRFYELISKLIQEKNIFPIVFGGSEDREKGERLIKRWKTGANAAGELALRQAAAAIGRCQLYVGNDTGTMHLAAAVNTPCIGIFAAIDWENRRYPYGKNHMIIRKKVACEGCLSPISFNHNKCPDLIEVKEVYQACVATLENLNKNRQIPAQLV